GACGPAVRRQPRVCGARRRACRRRRGRTHPARQRRRLPAQRGAARPARACAGGAVRRGRRRRYVRRHDPRPLARTHRHAPRLRGVSGDGRADDGLPGGVSPGEVRAVRGRDPPSRRPCGDRGAERGRGRLGPAPPGRSRRLPRGDRHAQGDDSALEERGVRRRRRVDRERVVTDYRDYRPVQPRGTDWKKIFQRIWAPIAAIAGLAVKFAFVLNLFNLIPIAFLDGGAIVRAAREAWHMPVIQFEGGVPMRAMAPDRSRSLLIWSLYLGLGLVLAYGMWKTHVPQNRL